MRTTKSKQTVRTLICFVFTLVLYSYANSAYGYYSQQQITIQGIVTDQDGNTLPGVSVALKGTTIGTLTDQDGKYSISLPPKSDILVFSFIGMKTQEVSIGNQTSINVVMSAATTVLEEVVVIGYGTMKKKDLTGAVASVKADRILSEKPQSVQDILRGNIAGLEVGFSTTAKGGGSLEIRGDNSLKTSSYPLIVVDGVIYAGSLDDINPYDIQSIDVLKDASSSAVFGARAANGVVLITTTKKGLSKRPTINFSSSVGLSTMATKADAYGPYEFITWRQDVLRSMNWYSSPANTKLYKFDNPYKLPDGVTMDMWMDGNTGDPQDIWLSRLGLGNIEINNYKTGKYVDWENKVYQNGLRQDYNISISGQKEETTYYWSLGYNNNEGIIVGDQFNTLRSRINLESKVTDWITVGLNSQFSSRDESGAVADWWQAVNNSPWGSFYKDDGVTMRWSSIDDPIGSVNPLYAMTFTGRKRLTTALTSNLYTIVKLPFGITYQLNFAPSLQFYEQYEHLSAQSEEWAAIGGQASREQSKIYNWQIDNIIKWNKIINDIHQIDITLLANAEKYQSWQDYMSAQGFSPTDVLGYHNMTVGKSSTYSLNSSDQYGTGDALMARAFYSLMNKYMLTVSVRRDGYSAFGTNEKRGTFPATALAWVFTDEKFMKNDFFYGKLRFSWGQNGNREIGRYDALSDMGVGKLPYQTLAGSVYESNQLYVNRMSNPELKWEKTQSLNLGLDFSIKKGLVDGSVEVYDSHTKDLLVDRLLPDVTGYTSVTSNLGEVRNKGLEITLNARIIEKKNLIWRSNLNFSLNRNEIVHLYGDMIDVYDDSGNVIGQREADDITNKWFIGHAIDQIWEPQILGVWQIGEEADAARYAQYPGDFHVKDINDDGKISQLDNVFQGYTQPRFRWNLREEFNLYKNIIFSFTLYSYWGHDGNYNVAKHSGKPERGNDYNVPYWTPENPLNDYARIRTYSGGSDFTVWRDRSFIRLDNVTLTYSLPTTICNKIHISDLKILGTVRNGIFWAPKWDFWDPEASQPNPRYFTLGINLTI